MLRYNTKQKLGSRAGAAQAAGSVEPGLQMYPWLQGGDVPPDAG